MRRLVDLTALGWPSLATDTRGLEIAATCRIRELHEFVPPDDWLARSLLRTSCEAFLASFKVWNAATVGGNICMSLPAGPMITMTVALEATYHLWAAWHRTNSRGKGFRYRQPSKRAAAGGNPA